VVGNVGSRDRFEYTAHGDTVNTAARLESANKHFGTRVCISGPAAKQCSDVTLRPIGDVIFKGKEEPLAVLSTCQDLPDEAIKEYLAAFDCLRQNKSGCIDSFSILADKYPEDALIAFQLERLKRGDCGTTIRMEQK
jgi:adenylate cyclase